MDKNQIHITKGDPVKIEKFVSDILIEINSSDFPSPLWKNIVETVEDKYFSHEITQGDDYDIVCKNFAATLPTNKILKVTVIQNYYLWKSYKIGIDRFKIKNNNVLGNEKLLWHGTN